MERIRNIILLLLFVALSQTLAFACNGCMTYDYNGIQTKNYLGLYYTHRVQQGTSATGDETSFFAPSNAKVLHGITDDGTVKVPNSKDYELFRTVDLRLNLQVKPWLNVMAVLPFQVNDDYYGNILDNQGFSSDSLYQQKGIGDLFVSFLLLKEREVGARKMLFRGGVGFYLPTGQFDVIDENGNVNDPSHQPGRGSVSVMLTGQMATWWYDKWGVLSTANYVFSTLSSKNSGVRTAQGDQFQYRFGNQFNLNAQLVHKFVLGDWAVIPKAGLYFEYLEKDKLNQTELKNTGGSTLFLPVGFDVVWDKLVLQANVFLPVYDNLNGEQLSNAGLVSAGILFNF